MKIQGYDMFMIRGDSETITVSCKNPDGTQHPFTDGDMVYFTVKKDLSDTEKTMQKVITVFPVGNAVIEILPEDTKSLVWGHYKYDVQLNDAGGGVSTIIPPSLFRVGEEVTDE